MREQIACMHDVLFEQMGEAAEYEAPDGQAASITVLIYEQDLEADLGGPVITRQGLHVQVRKAELPDPVKGATLVYNEKTYSVRDPRDADALGLLWLLPLSRIS